MCKKRRVANTVYANATAKAITEKSKGKYWKVIDLESTFCAKNLLRRIATSSRPETPARARNEAQMIFHREVLSNTEKHQIPASLVINIDQTPSKYAPISDQTLTLKNSRHVSLKGSSYKQAITGNYYLRYHSIK